MTMEDPADSTYKDLETVEFTINFSTNQYVSLNSVHHCFPSKTYKSTAKTESIDRNMKTVNNFFAPWIREIEVKRYGDDFQIVRS